MHDSFKILIVDDELQSRALIRKLLQDNGQTDHIFESGNVHHALETINTHHPALLFLDVQMKGETGFDLLNKFKDIDFEIIFTTAYSEYAIKAFRYNAMDYLMKPLDPGEFAAAFNKASARIRKQGSYINQQFQFFQQYLEENNKLPTKLSIAATEGIHFVNISDILYCHAVNNYTEFYLTNNQKIISSHTLGYYDDLLTRNQFFRIHRSYLINLIHIKIYKRGDGGIVIMNDGREIEVSRNNKEAFLKVLRR
jgi:two-component system LytT family response regulator